MIRFSHHHGYVVVIIDGDDLRRVSVGDKELCVTLGPGEPESLAEQLREHTEHAERETRILEGRSDDERWTAADQAHEDYEQTEQSKRDKGEG